MHSGRGRDPRGLFRIARVIMPTDAVATLPLVDDRRRSAAGRAAVPRRPTRRRTAAAWQDWLFERTTLFFALLVLVLARRHHRSRSHWPRCPRSRSSASAFFFTNVWNPVKRMFGALAPIYGTLVTSAIALADRRAGELRHRALPHRDVPGRAQASARHGGRAAGGDPVDHLRHVGPVRLRAALRRLRAAAADPDARPHSRRSARCSRARRTASAC